MSSPESVESKRFSSPREELDYLRERVESLERENEQDSPAGAEQEQSTQPEAAIESEPAAEAVRQYRAQPAEEILDDSFQQPPEETEQISVNLSPEEHDDQMQELMQMVQTKGVKNTLAIVEKMNNPHLEDDFHRFLVEYVRAGFEPAGLRRGSDIARSLHHILFEVILPGGGGENGDNRSFSEVVTAMEQLYAGLRAIADEGEGQKTYSIELALPADSEQYSFYVSVPTNKANLFEKQMAGIYPEAELIRQHDDYNIFVTDGAHTASVAVADPTALYPLKTYEAFNSDPMNVLLSAFSKIAARDEGAAVQIVISPGGAEKWRERSEQALHAIESGASVKEATRDAQRGAAAQIAHGVAHGFKDLFFETVKETAQGETQELQDVSDTPSADTQQKSELIRRKMQSPIMSTNIRILTSAGTEERADHMREEIEASFSQYENPDGDHLSFYAVKPRRKDETIKNYTFRLFDPDVDYPLSTTELTTMLHFETLGMHTSAQRKETHGTTAPAPAGLPTAGIRLGINRHQGEEREIRITPKDRLRHFYTIGQTGTGKTNFMKNMIIQDIQNGDGACMIDPHGVDIDDVLAAVPPERNDDVIYVDPAHTEQPIGLNLLEYDRSYPELKTFVVNELFKMFQKLYANTPEAMGPMFEQYFRNATQLVIDDPDSGNTLLDVSRVLSDQDFRDLKLSRTTNPVVKQFWEGIAQQAGGEASLQNIVPYITSKFDVFLGNDFMRPIIAQEQSSFNFRDIMDSQKILLVNLSKGRLGDMNAHLLGMIFVGKILMAALSRTGEEAQALPPFYLFIDEFQNFTTDSISTILSEARKYKLGLSIAHQFIAQLDEGIKDAVFGNVGSMAAFRIGSEDAQELESQFEPVFSADDLMNIDNYKAHLRLLIDGTPAKPFSLLTDPPFDGNPDQIRELKEQSYDRYGRDRTVVEQEIRQKYSAMR